MKNNITIAAIMLSAFASKFSFAQDVRGSQELSASYGTTSGTDMIQGFYLTNSRPNLDHPNYSQATSKTGDIFVTYRYFINRRLDLGVTLGTEALTYNNYTNPSIGNPQLTASYKASITTLAFELKPVYFNGSLVQLYGLIGLGGRYYHETQTETGPAYNQNGHGMPAYFFNSQWTPIGIRVGKSVCGFVELGAGYKGLLNAGISYRPGKKALASHKSSSAQ